MVKNDKPTEVDEGLHNYKNGHIVVHNFIREPHHPKKIQHSLIFFWTIESI